MLLLLDAILMQGDDARRIQLCAFFYQLVETTRCNISLEPVGPFPDAWQEHRYGLGNNPIYPTTDLRA